MQTRSCCRTIRTQLSAVDAAKKRLAASRQRERVARAVEANLDTCRSILGQYRVCPELTRQFRTEIEPQLAEVWTSRQLNDYATRLQGFTGSLRQALVKWSERYCKEALGI